MQLLQTVEQRGEKDSFIFNLTTLTAKFRPVLVNWLEAVYTFRDKAAASSIPV